MYGNVSYHFKSGMGMYEKVAICLQTQIYKCGDLVDTNAGTLLFPLSLSAV